MDCTQIIITLVLFLIGCLIVIQSLLKDRQELEILVRLERDLAIKWQRECERINSVAPGN
jgi:hypothetical protein